MRANKPTLLDLLFTTIWETITYHVWVFWIMKVLGRAVLRLFRPLQLLPVELQSIVLAGTAQVVWAKKLTSGQAKEMEVVLLKHLRKRTIWSREVLIEFLGVIIGLVSFTHLWTLLETASLGTQYDFVFKPALPSPKDPQSGNPMTWRPTDEAFYACLLTEFVMSLLHYYGVGLATLLRPKGVRGLLTFRQFATPVLATLGKSLKSGAPSLNSSVAIISALKRDSPITFCFAVVDIIAASSVIVVPRLCRRFYREFGHNLGSKAPATSKTKAVGSGNVVPPANKATKKD
eukprot:Protomagalhaensia_wolfi_Nauph_80__3888@NODE_393_length_2614_cov_127_829515_g297_i0_p2_GENE_NODE_393_length_2614_cov_127_829515_g297_i0NODE_393_length_2614_cov_127_829515_g297_i0_p2_ORF_typecomplete_len289_score21_21_NODE_393_length_2614_cov_127_829515_g297_i049915